MCSVSSSLGCWAFVMMVVEIRCRSAVRTICALAVVTMFIEPRGSNLSGIRQLFKEKRYRIRLILWSSIRSPESVRRRVGGDHYRHTCRWKKHHRKRWVHFAQFPQWGHVAKLVVEDLQKSFVEQIRVSEKHGFRPKGEKNSFKSWN